MQHGSSPDKLLAPPRWYFEWEAEYNLQVESYRSASDCLENLKPEDDLHKSGPIVDNHFHAIAACCGLQRGNIMVRSVAQVCTYSNSLSPTGISWGIESIHEGSDK